jgi:hypothetical protein
MFISVAHDNVNFKPVEVKNFNMLVKIMCSKKIKAYSFSTYENNYRKMSNFKSMRCIGLDIDNDKAGEILNLEDAKVKFQDYKHIIATTRSHQIEKNGLTVDRFRVVLFFENDVTDAQEFRRAWYSLKELYPEVDPMCKDESRYWFPSNEVIQIQKEGKYVDIPDYIEPTVTLPDEIDDVLSDSSDGIVGKLSYNTMKFFCQGADAGERNGALFKAAVDCNEQGYDIDYVKTMVSNMITSTGNWGTDYLNEKDIEAITNAYSRDVKYDKRDVESSGIIPFNFTHIKETLTDESIKTDWLIDGMLTVGGFSLFAGQPKSGKSTITRQAAISIAQGNSFLDRKVKAGTVYYLALEEQASLVKDQFIAQKVSMDDPIYVHYGHCSADMDGLKNALITNDVSLLIIDTMALFLNPDDLNNYDSINKMLSLLRDVARESGCHITLIHHQNKSPEGGTKSIMGSNAIHGAVDNAITFDVCGKFRYITTSQRGGVRFNDVKLSYNETTQTYKIAKKQKQEDDNDGF